LERLAEKRGDDLVEDRVAEIFLALEVMVKITLADSALPQHVVQGGRLIPPEVHQPGGRFEDRLARLPPVPCLVSRDRLNRLCHLYRPVGTPYAEGRGASSPLKEMGN